jgi:hypothetical protein
MAGFIVTEKRANPCPTRLSAAHPPFTSTHTLEKTLENISGVETKSVVGDV